MKKIKEILKKQSKEIYLICLLCFTMFGAMLILSISFISNSWISLILLLCIFICLLFLFPNMKYSLTLKEEIPYSKLKVLFDFKEPKHIKRFINFLIDTRIIENCNPSDKKQRELLYKFFGERYMLVGKVRLGRNMRDNIDSVRCDYSQFTHPIIPKNIEIQEDFQYTKSMNDIQEFGESLYMYFNEENITSSFSEEEAVQAIFIYQYCFKVSNKSEVDLSKTKDLSTVLDTIRANTKHLINKKS